MTKSADLIGLMDPNDLRNVVYNLQQRIQRLERSVLHFNELSEAAPELGDQRSGRFIASDSDAEPSDADFSGMFMAADLQDIADGNMARLAEVLAGIAQFWIANGAAWAGAGAVVLDADGLRIIGSEDPGLPNQIIFKDSLDESILGEIYTEEIGFVPGLKITSAGQGIYLDKLIVLGETTFSNDLPIAEGGTGASTAAGARANLGINNTLTVLDQGADLTIAGGEIIVSNSQHRIDTENGAAVDDLTSIHGTLGQLLFLRTVSNARSVTIVDNTTSLLAGNFLMGNTK
jgi:hypothetical protein